MVTLMVLEDAPEIFPRLTKRRNTAVSLYRFNPGRIRATLPVADEETSLVIAVVLPRDCERRRCFARDVQVTRRRGRRWGWEVTRDGHLNIGIAESDEVRHTIAADISDEA